MLVLKYRNYPELATQGGLFVPIYFKLRKVSRYIFHLHLVTMWECWTFCSVNEMIEVQLGSFGGPHPAGWQIYVLHTWLHLTIRSTDQPQPIKTLQLHKLLIECFYRLPVERDSATAVVKQRTHLVLWFKGLTRASVLAVATGWLRLGSGVLSERWSSFLNTYSVNWGQFCQNFLRREMLSLRQSFVQSAEWTVL